MGFVVVTEGKLSTNPEKVRTIAEFPVASFPIFSYRCFFYGLNWKKQIRLVNTTLDVIWRPVLPESWLSS